MGRMRCLYVSVCLLGGRAHEKSFLKARRVIQGSKKELDLSVSMDVSFVPLVVFMQRHPIQGITLSSLDARMDISFR